jgi:hypothetical protein
MQEKLENVQCISQSPHRKEQKRNKQKNPGSLFDCVH